MITAENGAEGLRVAREEHPNAMIMDISMPVLDGVSATERLKADPFTSMVIAYSASSHASQGGELFGAVCGKPCPPELLPRTLNHVLAQCSPMSASDIT